jgi:arylsulfate sulfotransferase
MVSRLIFVLGMTYPLCATITVTLAPSLPSPQPVGTTITWQPTASDTNSGTLDFQYAVSPAGQPYQILQEYDVANIFSWTQYLSEGSFNIQVTARNRTTGGTATTSVPFTIAPLTSAAGGAPVVTPTANALVALFSGPGCPTGSNMRVKFTNGKKTQRTAAIHCSPSVTSNFYVAGMLPSTAYMMNYEIVTGGSFTSGPILSFTTGVIPANLAFPSITVPLNQSTDLQQTLLLFNAIPGLIPNNYFAFATDLNGRVIWYYPYAPVRDATNLRPAPGGTILMAVASPANLSAGQQIFREIDLAGNTIRQTSTARLSQQLAALGRYPVVGLNHEVFRLPNGHTLLIASQEELFPEGTQPFSLPGPVDILGNCIIELDTNLQIFWSWSAYDHLDLNRPAVLGETCTQGDITGCPPLRLASTANDWLHGNSLWPMSDGGLLFSGRNQDFVYKIDWANGVGAGDIIWTLGLGGDFTMTGTTDPYPWFSHQHNASFALNGNTLMTVYDNGNTRVDANPGENSRGQALNIDETAKTVSLAINADLGVYSFALGSAELLDNGNYQFGSGWLVPEHMVYSAQSAEVTPSGSIIYTLNDGTNTYRVYRMSTLYSVP